MVIFHPRWWFASGGDDEGWIEKGRWRLTALFVLCVYTAFNSHKLRCVCVCVWELKRKCHKTVEGGGTLSIRRTRPRLPVPPLFEPWWTHSISLSPFGSFSSSSSFFFPSSPLSKRVLLLFMTLYFLYAHRPYFLYVRLEAKTGHIQPNVGVVSHEKVDEITLAWYGLQAYLHGQGRKLMLKGEKKSLEGKDTMKNVEIK